MQLRPYQQQAIDATLSAWELENSALLVMATGLGKTVVFAHLIERVTRAGGRAMVVAHREELIFQAADKIAAVMGQPPDVEMADAKADLTPLCDQAKVVVSSVQTQCAGMKGAGRMTRFDPARFSLLVIDEAHHATAQTYRRVIDYYRQNPKLKVLGVTATPDRGDQESLGQVFDMAPFVYDIADGVSGGWLVPILQRLVQVEHLDLSAVRTTGGDLNGADLARVMEYERTLHEVAGPTIELAGSRKTLIFAASVAHAERLAEILNRHREHSARWVCGETPKPTRRALFQEYAAGKFQFLVNVGVATEGFDDPGIQVVVMARPTKSRALYAQMAGRGTRPLPGVVDQPVRPDLFHEAWTPEHRRERIAASGKPSVEIIDFVGNAGRHKLICAADVLGGNYSDAAVDSARQQAEVAGGPVDVLASLAEAQRQLEEEAAARQREREELRRHAEAARAAVKPKAVYHTQTLDPFDVLQRQPWREQDWDKGRQPSDKMLAFLSRQGIETLGLTYGRAKQLCGELMRRFDRQLCTYKQAALLGRHGYPPDVSFTEATRIIDRLQANGWQRPADDPAPAAAPAATELVLERF